MSKMPPTVPPTMAPIGGGEEALEMGAVELVGFEPVCVFVAVVRPLAVGGTKLDPVNGGREMTVIESILNKDWSLGSLVAFIKVALCWVD